MACNPFFSFFKVQVLFFVEYFFKGTKFFLSPFHYTNFINSANNSERQTISVICLKGFFLFLEPLMFYVLNLFSDSFININNVFIYK